MTHTRQPARDDFTQVSDHASVRETGVSELEAEDEEVGYEVGGAANTETKDQLCDREEEGSRGGKGEEGKEKKGGRNDSRVSSSIDVKDSKNGRMGNGREDGSVDGDDSDGVGTERRRRSEPTRRAGRGKE